MNFKKVKKIKKLKKINLIVILILNNRFNNKKIFKLIINKFVNKQI